MSGQCDDDDNNSLNSSFWSDGGHEELLLEASEQEKADGIERRAADEGSGGTDGDDEGSCSSCDSPGLSLLTSGYGTSRPEEPDLGTCSGDQDRLVRSWSAGSETEDTLPDTFESYVRGRVGGAPGSWSPSCACSLQPGLRPKPKSCKYFQYKRLWDVFKLPGEADRAALRLEIKERLAYQPPPPRPPRVYVPNSYTVPTEKKRSALRWEVRSRLASGLVPWKFPF
ncbi:unnamed protein product, partial [Tetraodon nigroviridis]